MLSCIFQALFSLAKPWLPQITECITLTFKWKKEPVKVLRVALKQWFTRTAFLWKNQNIVIAQGVSTHHFYLFLSLSNIRKQFLSTIYTQKLQICDWLELNLQIESEGKWVWLHKFYCFSVKVISMHYSFINKWFKVCSAYKSQVEAVL